MIGNYALVAVLCLGILGLTVIYRRRYSIVKRQMLVRYILGVMGFALAALGYRLAWNDMLLISLPGSVVGVIGIQIALWSLGIRLDVLGTREVGVERQARTAKPYDLFLALEIIRPFLKLVDQFKGKFKGSETLKSADILRLFDALHGYPQLRDLALRLAVLNEKLIVRAQNCELGSSERTEELLDVLAELKIGLLLIISHTDRQLE